MRVVFDTVLFGVVFALTNGLSYLFIVVAGRALLAHEFGVFNLLLGLLTMGGIFATSLQVAVTRALTGPVNRDMLNALMRSVFLFTAPAVGVLTLAALPFASRVGADTSNVLLCGATLLAAILGAAALGVVVGQGKVRAPAELHFFGALARLGIGWPLMLLGLGIGGAMAGYTVNYLVVLALAYAIGLRNCLPAAVVPADAPRPARLAVDRSTMVIVVLAFGPFTLDQFLVQFFNPDLGGDYAATATIAKLIFFAAYPVTAVAYPAMLAQQDPARRLKTLMGAGAAVLAVSGGLAALLALFPTEVTALFFGGRFQSSASELGLLAAGVTAFSLSVLGVHAQIAWNPRRGGLAPLLALLLALGMFAVRHDSLAVLVQNQAWIYAAQLLMVLTMLFATVAAARRDGASQAQIPTAAR